MKLFSSGSMVLAAFCVSALVAHADDVSTAKAGMRERVAVIDKLKTDGAVGEASTGLLAVRAPGAVAEAAVAAENADRQVVFADLAKKTGGTPEAAGKLFAKQLAAVSKPGVWLQREDGGWYKK